MSFHLTRASLRTFAPRLLLVIAATAVIMSLYTIAFSQKDNKSQVQSGMSNVQRMDVMRSKLEAMKRSLESAVAAMPAPAKEIGRAHV